MQVVVIRHGITPNNVEGRFGGRLDNPLTEEAREDIRELVKSHPYPEVERIYRSPAIRCEETVRLSFPGYQGETEEVEDLWELSFGDYENVSMDVIWKDPAMSRAWREKPADFAFPGGEVFGECIERGIRCIRRILGDARGRGLETIAIVSHGFLLSEALPRLTEGQGEGALPLLLPNGRGLLFETTENADTPLRYLETLPRGVEFPDISDSPYVRPAEE